jgi:hypothetical protein
VPGRRAVRRRGLPLPRVCAPPASMREQMCESRYAAAEERTTADECATAADRTTGTASRYALVAEVVGPVLRATGVPIKARDRGEGRRGDRGSCGDGWDRPSRPARPPEERTASPYADASAATTADRFHSRGGLLRPAPLTGISPTGQQDPFQQDPPQQDPLQQGFLRQGFLRQGFLQQGPPPSGCRPSASTSRCGRQVVGTTGMASRRLARSLGGSSPLVGAVQAPTHDRKRIAPNIPSRETHPPGDPA